MQNMISTWKPFYIKKNGDIKPNIAYVLRAHYISPICFGAIHCTIACKSITVCHYRMLPYNTPQGWERVAFTRKLSVRGAAVKIITRAEL